MLMLALPPALACGHHRASTATPARTTSRAISAADLRTRLYVVADDSMGGRQVGRRGNFQATAYIAAEVRRMGLEPAGEGGTYFQTVPMVVRSVAPRATLAAADSALELWKEFAPIRPGPALPFSTRIAVDDAPSIYGGRAGDTLGTISPEEAADKVVVLSPAVDSAGRPAATYSVSGRASLERFPRALAIVIAAWDYIAPAQRSALQTPGTALAAPDETEASRPFGLLASARGAERILGAPFDGLRPGAQGRHVRAAIAYADAPTEAPARNVIAVVRGRDPALRGEYVAVGAHSDHIGIVRPAVDHDSLRAFDRVFRPQGLQSGSGVGVRTPERLARVRALLDSMRALRPPRADSIANGADDDGSGTVTALEIAEALSAAATKPRRSVLFAWHTGEEAGLVGSRWFTDNPTVPRDSIVAQLNMDMVGRGRAEDVAGGGPRYLQIIGSRRLSTELGDVIDSVNARQSEPFAIDYSFDAPGHPLNRYCRSDHYMYARYGIPISYFSRGYHIDYHMVSDEPQYIDYDRMAHVGALLRDVAFALADRDRRLVVDKPKPDPGGGCRQ